MIGRLYTWRGAVWLLVVCAEPFIAAPGMGPLRNVLLERVEPCYRDDDCAMYACACRNSGWRPTGERVVRPFRGLRRWQP